MRRAGAQTLGSGAGFLEGAAHEHAGEVLAVLDARVEVG
jgi:hypothetical protein